MVDLDTEIKPLNNAPNGLCKENLDNFQQFIKIAEGASDNASDILARIMSGDIDMAVAEQFRSHLVNIGKDVQGIKTKIDILYGNVQVLKTRCNIEKRDVDIKEEGLKSTVKFEASQNCCEEPKLETEDYEDFSSYHHDIDYTLSYDQDYFQEQMEISLFECDICNKKFKHEKILIKHKKKAHSRGKLKCQSCNYTSKLVADVRKHMHKHHEPIEVQYVTQVDNQVDHFQCPRCPFEALELDVLQTHVKNTHKRLIDIANIKERHVYGEMKCQFCDEHSYEMEILKKHMKESHAAFLVSATYVSELIYPHTKHYLCQECPFSSVNLEALDIHVIESKHKIYGDVKKEDDSYQQYSCSRCEYKTRHHICYLDHINGDLKWRKCPFCDEHFSMSSPNFFSHIRQHGNCYDDKAKYWVCSECPSRFKRIRLCTYLSHIYTAHQMGTPYHCPKCEFTTGSFELCQRHATVHDESSHPCPNCSYIAQSRFRLTKHIYNMHTNIECSKCNISFKVKEEYKLHMKDHEELESMGQENNICDHCGEIYTTHKELLLHKVDIRKKAKKPTLVTVGDFYCQICNIKCSRKTALYKHMKNKHPPDDSGVLECQQQGCEYKTRTKDGMKKHVEKVHMGIRWPCDLCKFVGGYKADLKRHIKIVHDGFALTCDQCTFSTPHVYVLNKHKEKNHFQT